MKHSYQSNLYHPLSMNKLWDLSSFCWAMNEKITLEQQRVSKGCSVERVFSIFLEHLLTAASGKEVSDQCLLFFHNSYK